VRTALTILPQVWGCCHTLPKRHEQSSHFFGQSENHALACSAVTRSK